MDEYSTAELPAVVRRLLSAVAALPTPQLSAVLIPGPWCAHVPLWSNPLLLGPSSVALEKSSTLCIHRLAGVGITTLGDLLRVRLAVETQRGILP